MIYRFFSRIVSFGGAFGTMNLLLFLLCLSTHIGRCASDTDLPWPDVTGVSNADKTALSTALLAGDWRRTATLYEALLPAAPAVATTVPYNFVGGLAFLVSGNDNMSIPFLHSPSASTQEARKQWEAWTEINVNRFRRNPTCQFLASDALMRNEQYERAKKILVGIVDHATVPSATRSLAYNGLGIAWAMEENKGEAVRCFTTAGKLEGFGDPWVNCGIIELRGRSNSPEAATLAARTWFLKALEVNPNNIYALSSLYNSSDDGSHPGVHAKLVGTYNEFLNTTNGRNIFKFVKIDEWEIWFELDILGVKVGSKIRGRPASVPKPPEGTPPPQNPQGPNPPVAPPPNKGEVPPVVVNSGNVRPSPSASQKASIVRPEAPGPLINVPAPKQPTTLVNVPPQRDSSGGITTARNSPGSSLKPPGGVMGASDNITIINEQQTGLFFALGYK